MLSPDTSGMPVKSPLMNIATAPPALKVPALVIVCELVEGTVATHCHLAVEPDPVFEMVPTVRAEDTGSLDSVNSVVSVLLAVPAPVPHPTCAPTSVL